MPRRMRRPVVGGRRHDRGSRRNCGGSPCASRRRQVPPVRVPARGRAFGAESPARIPTNVLLFGHTRMDLRRTRVSAAQAGPVRLDRAGVRHRDVRRGRAHRRRCAVVAEAVTEACSTRLVYGSVTTGSRPRRRMESRTWSTLRPISSTRRRLLCFRLRKPDRHMSRPPGDSRCGGAGGRRGVGVSRCALRLGEASRAHPRKSVSQRKWPRRIGATC